MSGGQSGRERQNEPPFKVTVEGAPETPESLERGVRLIELLLAIARKQAKADDDKAAA